MASLPIPRRYRTIVYIPSRADDTILEVCLSIPTTVSTTQPQAHTGVVIAHPYGPLGGSYNNNVVGALLQWFETQPLLVRTEDQPQSQKSQGSKSNSTNSMQRASFKTTDSPAGSQHPEQGPTSTQATLLSCVICAFNFRGCGKSKGRTSWTGEAEREDYQTVIDFLQSGSRSGTFQRKDGEEVGAAGPQKKSSQPTWNRKVFDEMGHEIDLPRLPFISRFILCGFSYGGLVASTISPPLRNPSDPTSRPLPTTYILVSYPAGVAWFLTTGNQGSFHRRAKSILQSESTESPAQEVETSSSSGKTNARKRPVEAYFITGSQDQFTSPNSLLSWLKSNAKLSPPKKLDTSSSWTVTRPDGAIQLDVLHNVDHFWLDHEDELLSRLQAWWKKSHPTNL